MTFVHPKRQLSGVTGDIGPSFLLSFSGTDLLDKSGQVATSTVIFYVCM